MAINSICYFEKTMRSEDILNDINWWWMNSFIRKCLFVDEEKWSLIYHCINLWGERKFSSYFLETNQSRWHHIVSWINQCDPFFLEFTSRKERVMSDIIFFNEKFNHCIFILSEMGDEKNGLKCGLEVIRTNHVGWWYRIGSIKIFSSLQQNPFTSIRWKLI